MKTAEEKTVAQKKGGEDFCWDGKRLRFLGV